MANFPQILDLGCGMRKRPCAIGLDIKPLSNADLIHDLSCFPYPFPDNSFGEVYVYNVLENFNYFTCKTLVKWLANRWFVRYERFLGYIFNR